MLFGGLPLQSFLGLLLFSKLIVLRFIFLNAPDPKRRQLRCGRLPYGSNSKVYSTMPGGGYSLYFYILGIFFPS